jgi:hypothetical protein
MDGAVAGDAEAGVIAEATATAADTVTAHTAMLGAVMPAARVVDMRAEDVVTPVAA